MTFKRSPRAGKPQKTCFLVRSGTVRDAATYEVPSQPRQFGVSSALEAGPEWGHFVPVKTANRVTLDFDTREEFRPGHYAFLVSDAEFDAAFARIRAQGVRYYADPRRTKPGEINHLHGGRGVYFDDPNGHVMEIITHPYGDRPEQI